MTGRRADGVTLTREDRERMELASDCTRIEDYVIRNHGGDIATATRRVSVLREIRDILLWPISERDGSKRKVTWRPAQGARDPRAGEPAKADAGAAVFRVMSAHLTGTKTQQAPRTRAAAALLTPPGGVGKLDRDPTYDHSVP